jgi:hypothetical protein
MTVVVNCRDHRAFSGKREQIVFTRFF